MSADQTFSDSGETQPRNRKNRTADGAEAFMRMGYALMVAAAFAVSGVWAKPAGAIDPKGVANTGSHEAGAPRVDSAKVHRLYLDGEFDAAIAILEENLKETRQYSQGDSAFIFKHLGVMYAAHYDTREKGKYYMHRLLLVEPTAKIMDMYASDMIYMIFKNIREEYEQSRAARGAQRRDAPEDASMAPRNAGQDRSDASARSAAVSTSSDNGKKWLWAGVAAVTVAAGVGAYVLMNEEPSKPIEKETKF